MTSSIMHSTDRVILDVPDMRESTLLAQPSWQFPALFSRYTDASGTSQRSFLAILQEREHAMGAATLSAQSIALLLQLLGLIGVPLTSRSFLWHVPTITAREKQLALPSHVTVLKTVTLLIATHTFLWTTVGDRTISQTEIQHIATMFGLSKTAASRSSINPSSIYPEDIFGIKVGMVSPFLEPGRPTPLSAVVFPNPHGQGLPTGQYVAISLSRYESLLVPSQHFPLLLKEYARHAYPQRVVELHECKDEWIQLPIGEQQQKKGSYR